MRTLVISPMIFCDALTVFFKFFNLVPSPQAVEEIERMKSSVKGTCPIATIVA